MTTNIGEMHLDKLDMFAMSQVIDYIYNGHISLGDTGVYDILYIAKILMIKPLQERCEEFLSTETETLIDDDSDTDVDDSCGTKATEPEENKPVITKSQLHSRRISRRKMKSERIDPVTDNSVIDIKPTKRGKRNRVAAKQIRIIKEDDGFRCPDCLKFYVSLHSLKAHMKIHDEKFRQHCTTCQKAFTRKTHLIEHEQTHLNIRTHPCNICGKFLSSARNLRRHTAIHDESKTFDCVPCALGFKTELELAAHRRSHTDYKHVCNICGDRYQYKSRLEVHLKCHHPTRDKEKYCCDICGTTYKSRYQLKEHLTIHSEEREYSCKICKKSFRLQRHYTAHLELHKNGKRFMCSVCGMSYAQSISLKKHARSIHGDEVGNILHQCNVCSKSFYNSRKFRIHCRSHLTTEAKAIPLGYAERDDHVDVALAPDLVEEHSTVTSNISLPQMQVRIPPTPTIPPQQLLPVTNNDQQIQPLLTMHPSQAQHDLHQSSDNSSDRHTPSQTHVFVQSTLPMSHPIPVSQPLPIHHELHQQTTNVQVLTDGTQVPIVYNSSGLIYTHVNQLT